jgi:hypothetical protein
MTIMSIAMFNAFGLPKQAISRILKLGESSSILLITETWLIPKINTPRLGGNFTLMASLL